MNTEKPRSRNRIHGNRRHGHTTIGYKSPTYATWKSMRARCDPAHQAKNKTWAAIYTGVSVCDRWNTFENFLADMGERPPGTSLDRWPNHHGNYEPGNCRWATSAEQANNTRKNVRLTHDGVTLSMSQWAHRLGVNPSVIRSRRVRGGSIERTLISPSHL